MDHTYHYDSPLGRITLASDGQSLTGLWFDGQKHHAFAPDAAYTEGPLRVFDETVRWLDVFFSGKDPGFTPRLLLRGSEFRRTVWDILMTVPYGQTVTYGQIAAEAARQMGISHMSARAVGGAVGHNPISLIVPCHRVIGADGSLTGYAGGLERKTCLLHMEGGI